MEFLTLFSCFRYSICSMNITTEVEFAASWLGSLISFIDFFIRKNCSTTNDLRAANSVFNGTGLSQGVVGVESLFFTPISLDGVLKVTAIGMSFKCF